MSQELKNLLDALAIIAKAKRDVLDQPSNEVFGKLFRAQSYLDAQVKELI